MRHIITTSFLSILSIIIYSKAEAQTRFSSGSGFYVSHQGHVVTNAHVIRDCKDTIYIRKAGDDLHGVRVVAVDAKQDLALLKSPHNTGQIAYLRDSTAPPRKGEQVMLVGFPEDNGRTGTLDISNSRIKTITDYKEGASWVLFEDSARHGNSGGPLLDSTGNVIGIVTQKMVLRRKMAGTHDNYAREDADAAIPLRPLRDFVSRYGVILQTQASGFIEMPNYIRRRAEQYVVSVLCPTH